MRSALEHVCRRKRWVLPFYFSMRICYMSSIIKCEGGFDLGLCTTSGLDKRMPLRGGNFRSKNVSGHKISRKSALHSGILLASPEVVHRVTSNFPLLFDSQNMYKIRTEIWNASARRLLPADMHDRWPKVCQIRFMFSLLRSNRFVYTTTPQQRIWKKAL